MLRAAEAADFPVVTLDFPATAAAEEYCGGEEEELWEVRTAPPSPLALLLLLLLLEGSMSSSSPLRIWVGDRRLSERKRDFPSASGGRRSCRSVSPKAFRGRAGMR